MPLILNKRRQKQGFGRVVPLGSNCYSAALLHELGLRRDAYPFDWLFSSPAMIAHALNDGFRIFLDPLFFEAGPSPEISEGGPSGVGHHVFYREELGVEWVFNHHDLTQPVVADAFRRRVTRFQNALRDGCKTLLLMVNTMEPATADSFGQLCEAVDRYGPDNTLLWIDVRRAGDVLDLGMSGPMQVGRHRRRLYRSSSSIVGVRFENRLDDLVLHGVVSQYNFVDALEGLPSSASE